MKQAMLLLILILVNLSFSTSLYSQDAPTEPVNIVIETNANAVVRRQGWSLFARLGLGVRVQPGDLIDPGGGAVTILCSNLSEQSIVQLGPLPCPQERPILRQGDQLLAGWQRAEVEDTTIPYLISPRATLLTTAYPLIQWNPVESADSYRVIIRGLDLNWDTTVEDATAISLRYPDTAPPLLPDVPYTVEIVEISGGLEGRSSREEGAPGISFEIMTVEEAEDIQAAADNIRSQMGDSEVASLIISYLYIQNGLYAEAIDLLTGIINAAPQDASSLNDEPVVYLLLGDLYLKIQLDLDAQASYYAALQRAVDRNDLEAQALASLGLARVLTNTADQQERVSDAVAIFTELGAETQIETIQQELVRDS